MSTYRARRQVDRLKKYDTVVSSGQSALRALLTMNGGATIAFLTFLGHLWDKGTLQPVKVPLFVGALEFFIYGTFAAVLAFGLIFLTNCFSSLTHKKWSKAVSNAMFGFTVLCGIASIAFFLFASWRAVAAFQSVSAPAKSVSAFEP
jgi:hypothetical protein